MEYTINYKHHKQLNSTLKTTVWKKKILFENLRTLTLLFIVFGALLLSLNNDHLYLFEIATANAILIPLLFLKLITDH